MKGKLKQSPPNPGRAGVIFDTELLRYSGYWSGGFITWTGVVFNGAHGANPAPSGTVQIATKMGPGWAKDGKLNDPRPTPNGPLPRNWGRYKGLYRTDKGIIFSYTVGDAKVLDMPGVEVHDKYRFFTRTINVTKKGKSATPLCHRRLSRADKRSLSRLVAITGAPRLFTSIQREMQPCLFARAHCSSRRAMADIWPVLTASAQESSCGMGPQRRSKTPV